MLFVRNKAHAAQVFSDLPALSRGPRAISAGPLGARKRLRVPSAQTGHWYILVYGAISGTCRSITSNTPVPYANALRGESELHEAQRGRNGEGTKVMEWFRQKTSIGGTEIHNWVLVLGGVIALFLIYELIT